MNNIKNAPTSGAKNTNNFIIPQFNGNSMMVQAYKGEAVVDVPSIAEFLGVKTNSANKLIKKHKKSFEIYGKVGFKIQPSKSGQKQKVYMLNEGQAMFLMNLSKNTECVVLLKQKLVSEFLLARAVIQQRLTGIVIRSRATDAIKTLVDYAKGNGSNNAKRYYCIVTKMLYSVLFNISKVPKDYRNTLNADQLCCLAIGEKIIQDTIYNHVLQGTHYKDIYQKIKDNLTNFAESIQRLK